MNRRAFFKFASVAGVAIATAAPVLADEMAKDMKMLSSGTFEGRSNHETSGGVKVITDGDRRFVVLAEDFSLDGGPDPRVGFGKDGRYDKTAYLGALLDLNGQQRYAIPSTMKIDDFNEIYIWCEVANVPLGVASLK